MKSLAENFKLVSGVNNQTTNGGVDSDYVCLKNVNKLFVVVLLDQAVGHATAIAPYQASDVAATGAKVLTNVTRILANEATTVTDTLVAQTAAKNYSVTADIAEKMIVFEIDPATLDTANNFDCVKINIADSSQATNFATVLFVADMKYKQATPPTIITD